MVIRRHIINRYDPALIDRAAVASSYAVSCPIMAADKPRSKCLSPSGENVKIQSQSGFPSTSRVSPSMFSPPRPEKAEVSCIDLPRANGALARETYLPSGLRQVRCYDVYIRWTKTLY